MDFLNNLNKNKTGKILQQVNNSSLIIINDSLYLNSAFLKYHFENARTT